MKAVFGFIAGAIGVYSILIFARILLSWFGSMVSGKPVEILSKITDPYLDWWRKNLKLTIGFLDFSAIAAIVFLSLMQSMFYNLASSEILSVGTMLAVILGAVWSIASFIIGFFMIIIVLRAFAFFTNRNIYSPFWRIVDNIFQPFMYKMNRLIFGNKIGNFLKGMIISFFLLLLLMVGGRFIINLLISFLYGKFVI